VPVFDPIHANVSLDFVLGNRVSGFDVQGKAMASQQCPKTTIKGRRKTTG